MRGVALCEALLAKTGIWPPLRPALGGLGVGLLALLTPQVMSSGHGAFHFAGFVSIPLAVIATMFILKAIASIVSLGSGFRGGLFFATLFLGALGGHLFAAWHRHDLAGPQARSERLCDHRHERAVGIGDRRAADDVVHRAGIHRQSLAHHGGAGRGHDLDPDHPRIVRLFVRDLAVPSARRNHPQRRRCRLDPRPHGAAPDAAGRDNRGGRHADRGIPRQVSAGLEDPGGRRRAAGHYAGLALVAEAHAPDIEPAMV